MLKDLLHRAYANTTVYRLVWTLVQLGAGAAAAVVTDDPRIGLLAAIAATVGTSLAREKLAERNVDAIDLHGDENAADGEDVVGDPALD